MSEPQPGQVVVVTGASGGIGRATAQACAARGKAGLSTAAAAGLRSHR